MNYIFNKSIVTIYEKPDKKSPISDEGLYGMECEIISETKDFFEINAFYGYTGFVLKADIEAGIMPEFVVDSLFADLLPAPEYKYPPVMTLPMGARINAAIDRNDRFVEITLNNGKTLYTHKTNIKKYSVITDNLKKHITETAKRYLGTQYRWGGKTPLGIDCSGLCFMSYYMNGYIIYRDAVLEKSLNIREISYNEAKPGDLLYFPGHIAMYLGDDMIIHSTSSFGGVIINSLNHSHPLYSEKHKNTLQKVGTLIT